MSKQKKTYSAEFKTKVVLELLKGDQTLNQIASKYEITPQSLLDWKKKFLENASLAFDLSGATKEYKQEIEELKEQNDQLAKTLGKVTIERDWAVKKLKSLGLSDKKSLVDSQAHDISLSKQCELLEVNRTSLYYKPKPINEHNLKILNTMDEIFTHNPDYGYRFIHQELKTLGVSIGKHRVLKYMNILGIEALRPKKKRITSIKDGSHHIYKYLLQEYHNDKKQVIVDKPNEVWSGDITYIRVNGGFMYLAAIIDWHTKSILAHKISNSMDATLATDVLQEALQKYPAPKIFNSDQGSQYTGYEHTQILKDNSIQISMNGKGRSIDNIAIERFFRTLKHNYLYLNEFESIKKLKEGVDGYIHKYNFKRFHSAINYQKPMNVYLEAIKPTTRSVA